MKSSIFAYDFFIASLILVSVIVAIINMNFSLNFFPQRKQMDLAISLDDKGVFWEDKGTINKSLNGGSAIIKCYKYTGTWDLDYEKRIVNSNSNFWYRMIRVHNNDFCTIDVGI